MFERPFKPNKSKKTGRTQTPWEFDPSHADQRAGPSAAAGDYYGIGVRNPMGRIRDSSTPGVNPVSKKQLGTPPKSIC